MFKRNQNVVKSFAGRGILTKNSPLGIAETCDVVISMLPSPSHVLDVYTGPEGILSKGNELRPWLFIDSSTIDPQTSRKVSEAISKCALIGNKVCGENPVMLDAPVSGGILAAETGTLTFMAGGSEEAYTAAKPLFLAMGKNTFYCGGAGNGSAAKICNNLALAISMLGVSEGFALGQSLGISAAILTKIFNSSSARCWSSDSYNPVPGVMEGVPSSRNYEGGFASMLMAKDLSLATLSAKDVGVTCPMTHKAEQIFSELCDKEHSVDDFSCVFRHYYSGKDENQ